MRVAQWPAVEGGEYSKVSGSSRQPQDTAHFRIAVRNRCRGFAMNLLPILAAPASPSNPDPSLPPASSGLAC